MFRQYSRTISAVVLFFFTWTSGGVFSVAHAAVDAAKKAKSRENLAPKKGESTEERFAKLTDDLRTLLADPKVDVGAKSRRLASAKSEMDGLDGEIRKQFAATEKRLKDAKLPEEILERHRKFVKHYDDNLAELKGNMEWVEKAADPKDAQAALEKTRQHLEMVQAPSRHHPLDPNNLPHRLRKPKKLEPRMKKEDFERDLKKDKHAWRNAKRIAVASTGSLGGIVPADDMAETAEVQITPEIKAKALELGNNPVKIYEWVRNNVEFVPTWGSIQGARMTLLTKQGNAFDTASLLIALLRAAGIHARYVIGTIELPIDKVMNWAGGFNDPAAALNFIASGGIPVTGLRSGGKVFAARMEHVWVKAYIDYTPSMGAVQKSGNTWIPLDGSFKTYKYSDGVDFKTLVPFDAATFAAQLKSTSTVNEEESYVTNVTSSTIEAAVSDYTTKLQNYVTQNLPNTTPADILGNKEILKKDQPILPATLPYKAIVAGIENADIPTQYRHRIGITAVDPRSYESPTEFTYSVSLPELSGKRITVSFDPATPSDKAVIDTYAAQQATLLPAYLIQVIPTLRIDNSIIATGQPIGMGSEVNLSISISSPNNSNLVIHDLHAGDYTAIGLNPSKISLDILQDRVVKNDFSEPVGEMLHQTALSYWGEVDAFNDVIAKTIGVRNLRHPSELAATAKISLSWLWGIRAYGTYKSRNLDVKEDTQSVMGRVVDTTNEFAYMQQSGVNSSFLEGAIFDQLFGRNIGDSISSVSAMKLADEQGIPIYGVDASSITAVIPKLEVPEEVKNEVANAVNAGLIVQIPKRTVLQSGWRGLGYIILNPIDGTGAYRISGGLDGGDSPTEQAFVMPTPKLPAIGITTMVVGMIAKNMGLKLKIVGGFIMGISPAAPIPIPVPVGNPWAMLCAILLGLIVAVVKDTIDTMNRDKEDKWVILRHYTTILTKEIILTATAFDFSQYPLYQLLGSSGGECPVERGGPYLTNDVFISPDIEENRKNISGILGIKDPPPANNPDEVTAYIDLKINTTDYPTYLAEFNVCDIRGGTQLHHSGTLFFGPSYSKQQYRLTP